LSHVHANIILVLILFREIILNLSMFARRSMFVSGMQAHTIKPELILTRKHKYRANHKSPSMNMVKGSCNDEQNSEGIQFVERPSGGGGGIGSILFIRSTMHVSRQCTSLCPQPCRHVLFTY
jgi:predicted ATP-grasp superfamily ATP-dependent carboligase